MFDQSARKPTRFDEFIGSRIILARNRARITQTELALCLWNVSFQALAKWERGEVKLPALRMWQIAEVAGVPVGFFFVDMPADLREEFLPDVTARSKQIAPARTAPKSLPTVAASRKITSRQQVQQLRPADTAFS